MDAEISEETIVKPNQSTPYLYINSNEHRSMGHDRWLPSVNEFTPHPLNEKVYGSPKPDKELIESIEKVGVLQPIVVNRNKQILSGHRRWQACKTIAESRPDKDFHILAITFEVAISKPNNSSLNPTANG